jgi:hypothetical protein
MEEQDEEWKTVKWVLRKLIENYREWEWEWKACLFLLEMLNLGFH